MKRIMDSGIIHKLAVLGKDYYSIRTIGDLFLFAGADSALLKESPPAPSYGSQRIEAFYRWVEALKAQGSDQLDRVLEGVIAQMVENEQIPESDRNFLRQTMGRPPAVFASPITAHPAVPKDVEQLLEYLVKGLPRSMFPLKQRRKNRASIEFSDEYDVQDLLHALLRPWIRDIRPEEYTPSYAGTSARMDFLLPEYGIVLEVKFVRDHGHGKKVGQELILDISHYQAHPKCVQLWIVVYDPSGFIQNPEGLRADLGGTRNTNGKELVVRTFILPP